MSTPVITYQTSDMTSLKPQGQRRRKFLLPGQSDIQFQAYSFDQDYEQRIDLFPPFPKNTPSLAMGLNDANAILAACSQPRDKGAAIGAFMATFSRIPATWNDFKEMPFTWPGFPAAFINGGRNIFAEISQARIQHDYFVLDPANIISACTAGAPANATSVVDTAGNPVICVFHLGDIPIINRTFFVVAPLGVPQFTNITNSITPIGGIIVDTQSWYQTLPSLVNYQTWIANTKAHGWQSTIWNGVTDTGGTIGQIVAEDSKRSDYSGCIIDRQTIYILVK